MVRIYMLNSDRFIGFHEVRGSHTDAINGVSNAGDNFITFSNDGDIKITDIFNAKNSRINTTLKGHAG